MGTLNRKYKFDDLFRMLGIGCRKNGAVHNSRAPLRFPRVGNIVGYQRKNKRNILACNVREMQ